MNISRRSFIKFGFYCIPAVYLYHLEAEGAAVLNETRMIELNMNFSKDSKKFRERLLNFLKKSGNSSEFMIPNAIKTIEIAIPSLNFPLELFFVSGDAYGSTGKKLGASINGNISHVKLEENKSGMILKKTFMSSANLHGGGNYFDLFAFKEGMFFSKRFTYGDAKKTSSSFRTLSDIIIREGHGIDTPYSIEIGSKRIIKLC